MRKISCIIILLNLMILFNAAAQTLISNPIYPQYMKDASEYDYFGTTVFDNYRWMETDTSSVMKEWIKDQNLITTYYLDQVPFRSKIREELQSVMNIPRYSVPVEEKGKIFFMKNNGLQNQSVLYMRDLSRNEDKVVVDPNKLSKDGTLSISSFKVSSDLKYMAYMLSGSGSDWNEIRVVELKKMKTTKDLLKWVKFSSIAWSGNGFYYSCYDAPGKGGEFSNLNEYHKVYYHELGTDQSRDVLVFENKEKPQRNYTADVTDDGRFLIIYETESTHGNALYIKDLKDGKSVITKLVEGFEFDYAIIGNDGETLYMLTNNNAPTYRLVALKAGQSNPSEWTELIPAKMGMVLESVTIGGNFFYVKAMSKAMNFIDVHDKTGKYIKSISLPTMGTVGAVTGKAEFNRVFFSLTSFTIPTSIYAYDMDKLLLDPYFSESMPEMNPPLSSLITEQVTYPSKDGTEIMMFIVHKPDLVLDGNNPVLLYGYGGFNISITPAFSFSRALFLANGGILAVPSIRGGGEFGEDWHKAGMREKKQNVFDDFIAAAEFLIKSGYTKPERLAISGGSNGGLLVGACMTQRPELFKVALPAVGVMDMLRYHLFTIGWAWKEEYGCADNEEDFKYLVKYSPLHNIRDGVQYPATLVTTGDHDDRVVPVHSFKFISTLQDKNSGPNPMLIRIETKAGHGAGKPVYKAIDEATDVTSFLFQNLGMEYKSVLRK